MHQEADEQIVLRKIQNLLHDEFALHHMTIQIEKEQLERENYYVMGNLPNAYCHVDYSIA